MTKEPKLITPLKCLCTVGKHEAKGWVRHAWKIKVWKRKFLRTKEDLANLSLEIKRKVRDKEVVNFPQALQCNYGKACDDLYEKLMAKLLFQKKL